MSYLTLGPHYPKPEHLQDILSITRRVADKAKTCSGIIEAGAWSDPDNDRIVMMSLWKDSESAMAARPILRPIIAEGDWQAWERKPSDNMVNLHKET